MSHRRGWLLAGAAMAALCLASTSEVRADALFQYSTTVTGNDIATPSQVDPTSTVGGPGSAINQTGVTLTSGNPFDATAPGTDIKVASVSISDLGIGTAYKDTYTAVPITVSVTIDPTTGGSATLTFTGSLSAYVNSTGSNWQSGFNNPWAGVAAQSAVINGVTYTVSMAAAPTQAPGAPQSSGGTGLAGGYSFHVTATSPIPEPSSVALSLIGIGSLAAVGFVRRRRARA